MAYYHLLAKMESGNRVKVLIKSVEQWVNVPTQKKNAFRQAGWVLSPHRFGRKTRQLAIRTKDKKGAYCYSVLITTDDSSPIETLVTDYDRRGGVPESTFCQDNQGLSLGRRRHRSFLAQQILTLLCQLAHNLIRWTQHWMIEAVEKKAGENRIEEIDSENDEVSQVVKTIKERGMKRFVRQIFSLSGKVVFKGKTVVRLILNPLYPLIGRIATALKALLCDYGIGVSLGKT